MSLEEVDPRASKSMGNFVKYIWITPWKQEEWEDLRRESTGICISPLPVCAGITTETLRCWCLSPTSEKAPEQCPGTDESQQGAAAQALSKLAQVLADFSHPCTVAGNVSGQVESWRWSIWMKSENTGIFYLPATSSEWISFQCRKVHLIYFSLLSFVFCAEIFLWTVPPDLSSRFE